MKSWRVVIFSIFNIINMISDPFCPGPRLADAGVGCDNLLESLFWVNKVCSRGSKYKRVFHLGMNITYMVTIFLQVKSWYVFEGAHGKLYGIWHGEFCHMDEQGCAIIHAWDFCNMVEHLGIDVPRYRGL